MLTTELITSLNITPEKDWKTDNLNPSSTLIEWVGTLGVVQTVLLIKINEEFPFCSLLTLSGAIWLLAWTSTPWSLVGGWGYFRRVQTFWLQYLALTAPAPFFLASPFFDCNYWVISPTSSPFRTLISHPFLSCLLYASCPLLSRDSLLPVLTHWFAC